EAEVGEGGVGVGHQVVVEVQQTLLEGLDERKPLKAEVVLTQRVEQPSGERVDDLQAVAEAPGEQGVDEAGRMGGEAPSVPDGLARAVLQEPGGYPRPDGGRSSELGLDVRETVKEAVELLPRRAVGLRVHPRVEVEPNADQRIRGASMVVEGDDP